MYGDQYPTYRNVSRVKSKLGAFTGRDLIGTSAESSIRSSASSPTALLESFPIRKGEFSTDTLRVVSAVTKTLSLLSRLNISPQQFNVCSFVVDNLQNTS